MSLIKLALVPPQYTLFWPWCPSIMALVPLKMLYSQGQSGLPQNDEIQGLHMTFRWQVHYKRDNQLCACARYSPVEISQLASTAIQFEFSPEKY